MSKGVGLRLNLPDNGAVARSLLAVLVLGAAALFLGPTGAATAAAAAGAIAGAVALQDNPLGRIPMVVAVSAALGVAVLAGGLSSGYSVLFVIVVALWGFLAGMGWAVAAPAGLIAGAAGILLVIQAPQPVVAAVLSALFAVVSGLVQAALIAVWPPHRWRTERDALRKVYRSLSEDARGLAADTEAEIDPAEVLELKEAFSVAEAQSSRRTRAYRDWHALPEQIAKTLMAFHGKERNQDAISDVLATAGEVLAAIAGQSRTARRDTEYALKSFDAKAATISSAEAPVVQRLSRQLHRADALRFGRRGASDWMGAVTGAVAVARGHLNTTSPIARHAVRLAGAAAAGTALARFAEVPEGHWIPLTVLLVMRPETAHTYTRCVGRVVGICAGIIVASALGLLWQPTGLAAVVVAVIFLGLTYGVSMFGYIAVMAGFSATIVFLLDIAGASKGSDLLIAAAIGGALAVFAHVLIPDDALIRLRQRAGELLKTEIDYAATVIKAFVHDLDHPADALAAAWQRAFRARAAFEAAAGATRMDSRDLRRWLRSFRTALNTVTTSCTALEESLPAHPSSDLSREFVLAVDDYVEALRGDPPTPATPWSIDTAKLAAADQQLHDAAAYIASDDSAARVLVAEVGTITRSLTGIAVDSRDAAAP
jgi:uncharacterized membrane protein YccC